MQEQRAFLRKIGMKFQHVGGKKPRGQELRNAKLESKLGRKELFSKAELDEMGCVDVEEGMYILVGDVHYEVERE